MMRMTLLAINTSLTAAALDLDPGGGSVLAGYSALSLHAMIWALELFFVQSRTLTQRSHGGHRFESWAPRVRMASNLCFALAGSFFIPTAILLFVDIAAAALCLLLMIYHRYFLRPLSIISVLYSWREAMSVLRFARFWSLPWLNALLGISLAIKLSALFVVSSAEVSWHDRILIGTAAIAGYLLIQAVTLLLDPLTGTANRRDLARLAMIRGYCLPWVRELVFFSNADLLAEAKARSEVTSDRLTPVETTVEFGSQIVVLQVESLDVNVVGLAIDGKPVTPFLNKLRERSLYYRVQATYTLGSADADFTMLAGGLPSRKVINYHLPMFQYQDSLPKLLTAHGYRTAAIHGNTGAFYQRRAAFGRMGFDELLFLEELETLPSVRIDQLGATDDFVLEESLRRLRDGAAPICHFIITLTSHTPFNFVPPDAGSIFPTPQNEFERYINHIHYVDRCLEQYVNGLSDGITVVVYSDHSSRLTSASPIFSTGAANGNEIIPCWIFQKGTDLASRQLTRDSLAVSGELSMLDMATYIRQQIRRLPQTVG